MKSQLQERLRDLRAELESGQRQMELLNRQRQNLQRTLLRISGAIQVLEELLAQEMTSETETTNGAVPRAVGS